MINSDNYTIVKLINLWLCIYLFLLHEVNSLISHSGVFPRTWSGDHAVLKDVPYVVLVLTDTHTCSGTVIHEYFILTAAHCFDGVKGKVKNATIFFGSDDSKVMLEKSYQSRLSSSHVYIHPRYSSKGIGTPTHADIALVEFGESIVEISDNTARPIKLDSQMWPRDTKTYKLKPRDCTGVGFGINAHNDTKLHWSSFKALHEENECDCIHGIYSFCVDKLVDDGFCQGDSGGPLVCNNELVGIVSANYNAKSCKTSFEKTKAHCGDTNVGTILTFMCPFLDWIRETISEDDMPFKPLSCDAEIIQKLPNLITFAIAIIISYVI